ncbi:hypothetical protein EJ04DRAFT_469061 [Polyplosphaeria fusca]|uniref:Uncharacterized protein n=1 Tax=Polyplosphaeria fusca TaxID=682080 RepID=A0A9P4QXR5_9PLEO|nr:hypothetical protein EJ04DRAFT_469061 [Polyplosphaeria fusca]
MSARRPLQPLSPLSANVVGAKYSYLTKADASLDVLSAMDERVHEDDTRGSGSIISGLSALESEADEFDRMMIQQARDQRRLEDARRGNGQPFRKARIHPNVGLTLDNLERNNARGAGEEESGRVKFESVPSVSSRSSGSDPAIRAPAQWGRKGSVRRDWMRTFTAEDQAPGTHEETVVEGTTPPRAGRGRSPEADRPYPSVEDSPLSHKSGTPSSNRRNAHLDRMQDWDLTMDMNEASLIASTPYLSRSRALDDIRQREMESLREQAVTTNRLDKIRESSPEESRRPRSSSRHSVNDPVNEAALPEHAPDTESPGKLRKRTNSWKLNSKSQPGTGDGNGLSPIVVYKKSAETVGSVDRGLLANAQTSPKRPYHRREDSHDLLRKLARVSSQTPSPGRSALRPQTAPAASSYMSHQSTEFGNVPNSNQEESASNEQIQGSVPAETATATPDIQTVSADGERATSQKEATVSLNLPQDSEPPDNVDATPMPVDASIANAKTPRVTGAWVDTPAPRRSTELSSSPPKSPPKTASSKSSPEKRGTGKDNPQAEVVEPARPTLPKSALQAIVEEARANGHGHRYDDQYGDSTINSLEDIISPNGDGFERIEQDEDTLQGIQLPTTAPRNEAERQRQKEAIQLHSMHSRLQAARTGIRDVNRGIRRVERRFEDLDEGGEPGVGRSRVVLQPCPCTVNGHHQGPWTIMWSGIKSLFYDPTLSSRWGLTWFTIALVSLFVWYIAESTACFNVCNLPYAPTGRPAPYGVYWDAPIFPFVLPTLLYRNTIRPFWRPFWALLTWIWRTASKSFFDDDVVQSVTLKTARQFTRTVFAASQTADAEADFSMNDDELL